MELEIRVMWCRGLTAFNFFQKLTVYAAVSINSEDQRMKLTQEQKQEQKTPVDEEGDGNPEWNYTMKFDLNSIPVRTHLGNFTLHFELRRHGQLFGDKNIGEVRVPLKDLIESVGSGVVRFASYEVRTSSDGKPNGVLDFSYKLMGDVGRNCFAVCSGSEIQITGYNHHHNHHHHDHDHDHDRDRDHDRDHSDDLDRSGLLDAERIEYPRIELEELSGNLIPSVPPLVGGVESRQSQQYYPPPSYPPPGPPVWGPPPPHPPRPQPRPQPSVYPPPPPPPQPQPLVYPPPPPSYGNPHWGYERPPYGNHHW